MALGWKQKILNVETSSPPPASLRKMLSARTDVANCLRFVNPGAYIPNQETNAYPADQLLTYACVHAHPQSEENPALPPILSTSRLL